MNDKQDILAREIGYTGEKISVRSLEESISEVRKTQDLRLGDLQRLQQRNVEIQSSLEQEIRKLRKLSDYVSVGKLRGGFFANLKEILSFIPFLRPFTRRSIEELLRQQYEISARRVKEASEFADKLKAAESDLHDEIERLNARILEAARNEDVAAAYVLELEAHKQSLEQRLAAAQSGTTEAREAQAELDRLRRVMSEHSTLLQLYSTSEERLGRLKDNTRRLLDTIANLATDITQYVHAASEKLDLVAGQIQAIGTAADASVVMLELKRSLDSMTDSMNQTTRFVSETQIYFRNNLDKLLGELELYDNETRKVMDKNLALSKEVEDRRIREAVQVALERRKQQVAP
jgi:hypothetical protein